ncbi:hypothetical protein CBM2617_A200045 [Cupriavidus taiwanensis]|nr:hypothetical protein CBM2617_A200045 [Cupriavidus taiwanensis]SOZ78832.1 hypothetical protein CBM2618_A180047 [Cupriavidus taiwanensis]SOZ79108.1 hypothetical protein CBM2622_A170045 [Cupriavidus taiwanensis]
MSGNMKLTKRWTLVDLSTLAGADNDAFERLIVGAGVPPVPAVRAPLVRRKWSSSTLSTEQRSTTRLTSSP